MLSTHVCTYKYKDNFGTSCLLAQSHYLHLLLRPMGPLHTGIQPLTVPLPQDIYTPVHPVCNPVLKVPPLEVAPSARIRLYLLHKVELGNQTALTKPWLQGLPPSFLLTSAGSF